MIYKVFYDKKTLEIKGYSDGAVTMSRPFVESEIEPILLWNYKVENGKLETIKKSFTNEEWQRILETGVL